MEREELERIIKASINDALPVYIGITAFLQKERVHPTKGAPALILAAIGQVKRSGTSLEELLALVATLYQCYHVNEYGNDTIEIPIVMPETKAD
jgi:hypothetical protein